MLFKSKAYRELEEIITEIRNDLSNNYKDNAVIGINKFRERLCEAETKGELKEKELDKMKALLESFQNDVANFKRTY